MFIAVSIVVSIVMSIEEYRIQDVHGKPNNIIIYIFYIDTLQKEKAEDMIHQSLFGAKVFSFLTPAEDFLSAGDKKNKLGPSFGWTK